MRAMTLAPTLLVAALWPGVGVAADSAARAQLVEQLQVEARDFCRKVHDAAGSLDPKAIIPAEGEEGPNPDLLVDYRGVSCDGVDDAPLRQGGFCGLTMDGVKCKVARFSYRDGKYIEVASTLE